MSELTGPIRTTRTAPRDSERAAVERARRARLALVPVRAVGAPRAPFAVLVFLILGAGVVGLLMFNTQMQQDSFYATRLQQQADRLTAQREGLQLQLESKRDPQQLAQAARQLGMVAQGVPSGITLADGKVFGVPTVATRQDGVGLYPRPAALPKPLRPKPLIKTVKAETPAATTGQTDTGNGPASTGTVAATGRNDAGTAAPGAPR